MAVSNRIKELREQKNLMQKEVADALGVSRQTMTAIETGKYNPSLELTLKIAKFFNQPVEAIFSLEEE
ncbi:helix-turn-helix transcriptional regulator [Vagococcus sp. BWB3-3]|uniref:Helix-turn-helix transcriptional regulator n=1 Tax=Vagococcus allomyrinae TaxID=2794353 RepID=A0A940P9R4_9ENTE|nr:helix-turn-helix transcriptional regulator [Vagococcus allomyrinae]MBP1041049.1 helix-turn-helix transcriptional regulator [Vagococcus allomyrinae]